MKIVVCFCLSLPVEFVLYPTCNVCCFLSMYLFLLPMGLLSSLKASILRTPTESNLAFSIVRLNRIRDSVSH